MGSSGAAAAPLGPSSWRAQLLAIAAEHDVCELAEQLLADPAISDRLQVILPAETGTVVLEVREPVEEQRMLLADIVVSRAQVAVGEVIGWSMRLGTNRAAALAAAVCDAAAQLGGDSDEWSDAVDELCRLTARRRDAQAAEEWQAIAPTAVTFEEIDR